MMGCISSDEFLAVEPCKALMSSYELGWTHVPNIETFGANRRLCTSPGGHEACSKPIQSSCTIDFVGWGTCGVGACVKAAACTPAGVEDAVRHGVGQQDPQ